MKIPQYIDVSLRELNLFYKKVLISVRRLSLNSPTTMRAMQSLRIDKRTFVDLQEPIRLGEELLESHMKRMKYIETLNDVESKAKLVQKVRKSLKLLVAQGGILEPLQGRHTGHGSKSPQSPRVTWKEKSLDERRKIIHKQNEAINQKLEAEALSALKQHLLLQDYTTHISENEQRVQVNRATELKKRQKHLAEHHKQAQEALKKVRERQYDAEDSVAQQSESIMSGGPASIVREQLRKEAEAALAARKREEQLREERRLLEERKEAMRQMDMMEAEKKLHENEVRAEFARERYGERLTKTKERILEHLKAVTDTKGRADSKFEEEQQRKWKNYLEKVRKIENQRELAVTWGKFSRGGSTVLGYSKTPGNKATTLVVEHPDETPVRQRGNAQRAQEFSMNYEKVRARRAAQIKAWEEDMRAREEKLAEFQVTSLADGCELGVFSMNVKKVGEEGRFMMKASERRQ
jgi:hypothetical protein